MDFWASAMHKPRSDKAKQQEIQKAQPELGGKPAECGAHVCHLKEKNVFESRPAVKSSKI